MEAIQIRPMYLTPAESETLVNHLSTFLTLVNDPNAGGLFIHLASFTDAYYLNLIFSGAIEYPMDVAVSMALRENPSKRDAISRIILGSSTYWVVRNGGHNHVLIQAY